MAQRFVDQASAQLAPVYDAQQQALQSQIPAIQQLYQTLTQGLQQQNTMQLNSGVQQISEDASRRGVLRSSLPVDARTSLTAQLGAALNQGLGELGAQQAKEVAGVGTQIGELGIQRAGAVSTLADALQQRDLEERGAELKRQQAERDYQISLMGARGGGGGGGLSSSDLKQQLLNVKAHVTQGLASGAGKDGFVSRATFGAALNDWQAGGGSTRAFWQQYGRYANPKTKAQYPGYAQR